MDQLSYLDRSLFGLFGKSSRSSIGDCCAGNYLVGRRSGVSRVRRSDVFLGKGVDLCSEGCTASNEGRSDIFSPTTLRLTSGGFVFVINEKSLFVPNLVFLEDGFESATKSFGSFPLALRRTLVQH